MRVNHLIGIGGVGMSALAQALLDAGERVTGADRCLNDPSFPRPDSLAALSAQGVALYPDDGSSVTPDVTRVVVSTAIEEANPGLAAARARGVPVVHRAKALAELLSPRKLVAVVGTCGKSTVTALLGHLLARTGFDPVVVNGAAVAGWNAGGRRVGSVRPGNGAYAVAEVDESDKSLVVFSPYAAVVTNASADHYSEAEMNAVFDAFVAHLPGPLVEGRRAAPRADRLWEIAARVPMPGEHNRMNAYHALAMAAALGADEAALAAALEDFPGVERRLQRVGACAGAVVYDDYAHNPEKLSAMWRTLAAAYPKGVAVLWRPHGYGPLRKMMDALAAAFAAAKRPQDALFLLPVYDAGGTADRRVNSDALAARTPGVVLVKDLDEAESVLRTRAPAFGAIVTAGARDPGLPLLARRLTQPKGTP